MNVYATLPVATYQREDVPHDIKGVDSFHRCVISARSIPFGIKVLGIIRYPFFTSPGAVYGLTKPLHLPSKVMGVAHSSRARPGEFLYFTVLRVRLAGVFGPEAFPEILEIETLIKSTSGIVSSAI